MMSSDLTFRRVILALAGNSVLTRLAARHGLNMGARRFVSGQTLEDGVRAVQALGRRGLFSTLDYLGEKVQDLLAARQAALTYQAMVRALAAAGLEPNVSLKLSQFGLTIDRDACLANLRSVLQTAAGLRGFVRIDMEESSLVDPTLQLFREVAGEFNGHVGIVLQAYLYRTEEDLARLLPLSLNVRLCKGAYSEPPSVAFPKKRDVDRNFVRLIGTALEGAAFTAVATHDERIMAEARRIAGRQGGEKRRHEFQMLYGVRPRLQERLVREGERLRIYVPFGTHWYPYFVRRLAERPANLIFVVRGLGG